MTTMAMEDRDYELGAYGDPRRCKFHGCATSSPDGMFDAPCPKCEAAMDDDAARDQVLDAAAYVRDESEAADEARGAYLLAEQEAREAEAMAAYHLSFNGSGPR